MKKRRLSSRKAGSALRSAVIASSGQESSHVPHSAVVAGCVLQCFFNPCSVGVAALLPSNLLQYALLAPDSAMAVEAADWLGERRVSRACTARARHVTQGNALGTPERDDL